MASVSVSHLIIFIASIVVAASVVGVFTESVNDLSNAIDEQGVDVSNDVRTDIEIISDGGSDNVYDSDSNGNITLHVKNTGSNVLDERPPGLDVFVNGQFVTGFETELKNDVDRWRPGDVLELEIDHSLDPGDHRVKVIVDGDEEVFEFKTT
jgi:flagellar protein FlaG